MKFIKTICCAAIGLSLAFSAAAQTHLPQTKVYETGTSLTKPPVLRNFVEFHYARKIPALKLYTQSGAEVNLADYKGEVVILNVWATWCMPCVAEIPSIIKLQKELKGTKVKIVGVSVDNAASVVPRFLKRKNFQELETWVDPTHSVNAVIPLSVVPTNYILDGQGNLIGEMKGFIQWDHPDVLAFLKKLGDKYADPKMTEPEKLPVRSL